MANELTTDVMNEAICLFMGFEKVRIGYFGCKDGDPEYDETDWQVANEKWLEKMGIENIGYYVVNVNGNEWYQWRDVEYHTSWDWLMPVVEKCQFISKQKQAEFYENNTKSLDDPLGWRSWSYRYVSLSTDINKVHNSVYQFITWYNQQKQKDGE